ncbi:MAG: ABC transporter permease, partial [Thermoplasmata archaeon]
MIKPKGLGQTVRDLEIILEPGFTPGNEYVIPGNITVTGEPLQLNGQKFLVVTHDKGITFLRYNYSLVYPGPLPKNWVFSVFGNYSFNPSPKTAPITSKFYMDYGGYNNRTPIVAAGTDGKLYLFRLDAQEISKPQKYEVGTSTEEIASIAVTYEEEFQVYAGSENGKIKAYFYNRTWMNLTLYWEKDLGGKLVEPFAYSKVPTDRLYLVIEKEGTREMWVLGLLESAGTKAGDLRYKFETPKNISRPFPTGQKMQFTVRKYYDPGSGETKYENDTGEIVLLCDRNTYGILFVAEKVRTPLAPGTYPSGNTYWLGTDTQGRDILSRLVWGSQIALFIGVTAAVLSMLLGTVIGLVSGYYGGSVDLVLMRITDVFLVIPFLPLVIILAAVLGSSIMNIIYVLVLIGWPGIARVIRSVILSLKERPFIDAARVTGASHFRIMFKHLFPNVVPLAVLYMTFTVSGAILTEAALSFIGLGDPNSVSWGMILHDAQYSNAVGNWWMTIPAGLCITLVSMGFYLVGRAVEQIINPRLRSR